MNDNPPTFVKVDGIFEGISVDETLTTWERLEKVYDPDLNGQDQFSFAIVGDIIPSPGNNGLDAIETVPFSVAPRGTLYWKNIHGAVFH